MDETPNPDAVAEVATSIVYAYLHDQELFDEQPSDPGLIRAAFRLHTTETQRIQTQERRANQLEALPTKLDLRVGADNWARINNWLGLWRENKGEARHQTARTRLLRHFQEITVAGLTRNEEGPNGEGPVELKEQLVELPVSFLKHQHSAWSLVLQNVRLVRDCAGAVSLYAPYCLRICWQNVRFENDGDNAILNLGAPDSRLRHSVELEDVRVNNIYLGHDAAETKAVFTRVQAAGLDAVQLHVLVAKDSDFHDVSLVLRHTREYSQKRVSINNCRVTECRLDALDRTGTIDIKGGRIPTITLATVLGRTYISDCPGLTALHLEPARRNYLLAQRVELSIVGCTALRSLWVPEFRGHLYLKGCEGLRALRTGREIDPPPARRGLPGDDADLDRRPTTVWHVTDSAGSLATIDGPYRGGHSPVLLEIGADRHVDIPLQRCVLDISGFLWVSIGPYTSRIIRWQPRPLRLETYALNNDAQRPTLALPDVVHAVPSEDSRQEWPIAGGHALEEWWSNSARLNDDKHVLKKFEVAAFCLERLVDNLPSSEANVAKYLRAQAVVDRLRPRAKPDVSPNPELVEAYAQRLWQTLQELRGMPGQVAAYAVSVLDRGFLPSEEKKEARDASFAQEKLVRYLLQHVLFQVRKTEAARAAAVWLNGCKPPNVAWPHIDSDSPVAAVVLFLSACQREEVRRAARTPALAPTFAPTFAPAPAVAPTFAPADDFESPPRPPAPQHGPPRPTKASRRLKY
eukprot:g44985.t1